ncbi:MAG TPA: AAA family ATPase [Steroidobacteraceae bacterium]
MIRLQTLGTLEVTLDGAEAPSQLLWKKNVALLLYLARAPKRRCTREQLIGLLWPDKDDAAARQSVREAIRMVRHYVGDERLTTAGDVIQLEENAVELDTDQFDRLVKQRDWAATLPLINGKFLDGFKISDAAGFEDWLTIERSHWNGRSLEALLNHAEACLASGDEQNADAPLRKARDIDPLSQRALRAAMRRLAAVNDRSGALRLFDEYLTAAQRDGGINIEPETKALVERLRSGRAWHLPREALAPEPRISWRRAPLLGRQRELTTALAQWRTVRTGRLGLLVLEAESGGGKTRFIEELATRAGLDGGVIVAMRAVQADVEHSGGALLSLARGGLVDAPGVAGANPTALATLAAHASEWAERFPQKQVAGGGSLDAAVAEVLRVASAEQPLLLVFDDAQWIDPGSYQTIEQLTRDLARAAILIVLATTPEPAPPKLAELRARIGRDLVGAAISLGKLTHDAIVELIHWALPGYTGASADRLARRIEADSGGLPLLAVEICRAMAEGLDLESMSGSWPHPLRTLDSTFPGDLPDTIVAAIRVNFRCLSRAAQHALIAAAILGERVSAKRIGCGADLTGDALHAALDELEWRNWLVAEARGYVFVARIVRDVVARDMVTAGERQRMLAKKC